MVIASHDAQSVKNDDLFASDSKMSRPLALSSTFVSTSDPSASVGLHAAMLRIRTNQIDKRLILVFVHHQPRFGLLSLRLG